MKVNVYKTPVKRTIKRKVRPTEEEQENIFEDTPDYEDLFPVSDAPLQMHSQSNSVDTSTGLQWEKFQCEIDEEFSQ